MCVLAVFRGSGLGTAWSVGVGVYARWLCFVWSGLGTALPVGVGVYARSLRFVGAGSVMRGPLGSGFMCWLCVSWEPAWYGMALGGQSLCAFAAFRGSRLGKA